MKNRILLVVLVLLTIVCLAAFFSSRPVGTIKLNTPGVETSIILQRGWHNKRVSSRQESVSVRAGTYRPRHIELRAEKDGAKWSITGCAPWGELELIDVRQGQTTILTPGPPLSVKADVYRRHRRISIGFSIIGQAGEHYQPVRRNANRMSPPKLKIVDTSGQVLASGRFEYG